MLARPFAIVRRALILVFAAISMFGCVMTSAMAHTAGQLAEAMTVESHGHPHAEDSRTLHEMAHAGGTADLSHDSPCSIATIATSWAAESPAWVDSRFSMAQFGLSCTTERPPRA
jgi:hypothetical protein